MFCISWEIKGIIRLIFFMVLSFRLERGLNVLEPWIHSYILKFEDPKRVNLTTGVWESTLTPGSIVTWKEGNLLTSEFWAPPDLHWSPLVPGYGCKKYEIRHLLFLTQSTLRILASVPLFIPFPTPNTSLLTQLQSQNSPKLQSQETFQRHFSSAEPPNYSPLTV